MHNQKKNRNFARSLFKDVKKHLRMKEKIYYFIHSWIIPLLHATLWIIAYYGRDIFFSPHSEEEWYPVVDAAILCVAFFMEIVITLIDIFFANSKYAASMSIFIPVAGLVGLLAVSFALVALYLVNLADASMANKFLWWLIIVSAGAKYMEIWMQNNVSLFVDNYYQTLRKDGIYAEHYRKE